MRRSRSFPADAYKAKKEQLKEDLRVPWVAYIKVGDQARELIRKLQAPKPFRVRVSQHHGYFVVTDRGTHVHSYSWTLHRRPGGALIEALNKSWDMWAGEGWIVPQKYRDEISKIDPNAMFSDN